MNGQLSTHVLDLASGRPAEGMIIELRDVAKGCTLKTVVTNRDGRTEEPLLSGAAFVAGEYELIFHLGTYFGDARFLECVPVRFRIADAATKYHIPLLCTPWAYSTYRGS